MTHEDLDTFEKLFGQLQSIYDELSLLSKKAPNDAVNKFKLTFTNGLLIEAGAFLGRAYLPFKDFGTFNIESVPQYSDVVFILAQYLQCFEKYRADNVVWYQGRWQWAIKAKGKGKGDEKGMEYVISVMPKRLRSPK